MLADARFERSVIRRAREIIAISPYVLDVFRRRTHARFHLIENPVDGRFFTVTDPPPGRDRLLCVGRVIPRKGILALIEAFAQVARTRLDATLVIAGETETDLVYVERCRERVAALGLADRVRFTGGLAPDAVRTEYAACDLALLASEQETAPVTIAEAMAAGRAVVTTDVGGCAAMVEDGVNGRVVPPRAPAALAAAVLELLAAPEHLREMGQAARTAAERRFRLDAVVEATVNVYGAALAAARRGVRRQEASHDPTLTHRSGQFLSGRPNPHRRWHPCSRPPVGGRPSPPRRRGGACCALPFRRHSITHSGPGECDAAFSCPAAAAADSQYDDRRPAHRCPAMRHQAGCREYPRSQLRDRGAACWH